MRLSSLLMRTGKWALEWMRQCRPPFHEGGGGEADRGVMWLLRKKS